MSTLATPRIYTPEDLDRMPDGTAYELVDGNLVERNVGLESSAIAARIIVLLGIFLRGKKLGHLFLPDGGFRCFPDDPNKLRRPDGSFIRAGRLPNEKAPKGYARIAPDLAIEVVSPNDTAEEIEEKIKDWLAAGVPLLWVVYPATRTVRIHRPPTSPRGRVAQLIDADTLTGEDVLPEFSCPVREIFED